MAVYFENFFTQVELQLGPSIVELKIKSLKSLSSFNYNLTF